MHDERYKIQDAGCMMKDTRCKIQDAGYRSSIKQLSRASHPPTFTICVIASTLFIMNAILRRENTL